MVREARVRGQKHSGFLLSGGKGWGRGRIQGRGVLHIFHGGLGTLSISDNSLKKLHPKGMDIQYTEWPLRDRRRAVSAQLSRELTRNPHHSDVFMTGAW